MIGEGLRTEEGRRRMKVHWLWSVCLWLTGIIPCCQAQKPAPLRLPASVVLRMTRYQFEQYCADRDVSYRSGLKYYQTCQLRQNTIRLHRLSPRTQKQWWRTRTTLYRWLDDFYGWRHETVGHGTWQLDGWLVARVLCEQGMSRILDGYASTSMSRWRSRKRVGRLFSEIKQRIIHAKPYYLEERKEFLLAQAILLQSTKHLEHYAALRSPNTQRTIANCIEQIEGEAPE